MQAGALSSSYSSDGSLLKWPCQTPGQVNSHNNVPTAGEPKNVSPRPLSPCSSGNTFLNSAMDTLISQSPSSLLINSNTTPNQQRTLALMNKSNSSLNHFLNFRPSPRKIVCSLPPTNPTLGQNSSLGHSKTDPPGHDQSQLTTRFNSQPMSSIHSEP